MANNKPWYVVVERDVVTPDYTTKDKWIFDPLPPYVTGPFDTEAEAEEECDSESSQTFCFLTIDAKNDGYKAGECYYTQKLPDSAILFTPSPKDKD